MKERSSEKGPFQKDRIVFQAFLREHSLVCEGVSGITFGCLYPPSYAEIVEGEDEEGNKKQKDKNRLLFESGL